MKSKELCSACTSHWVWGMSSDSQAVGDGKWGSGGEKDLIIQMIKAAAMEVGKANYESCYGKCWLLISSGLGGGEQGTSIC